MGFPIGWIELDGLFGNELTGLCRPEELMQLMEASRKAAELCGVAVESAMISDVPGYTWGLVPVMAQYGIKYFSIGTNTFHRIGDIIETWGDRPFYVLVSGLGKSDAEILVRSSGGDFAPADVDRTEAYVVIKVTGVSEIRIR